MNNCRAADHYQLQVTAILSQNTSDVTLFRAVMTMRKLGLMDKRWLGSGEDDTLRKLENVLLYSGYNLFNKHAAYVMGHAYRIVTFHNYQRSLASKANY